MFFPYLHKIHIKFSIISLVHIDWFNTTRQHYVAFNCNSPFLGIKQRNSLSLRKYFILGRDYIDGFELFLSTEDLSCSSYCEKMKKERYEDK